MQLGDKVLGQVDVDNGAKLARVRELIKEDELDDEPGFYRFVNANGMKVSVAQEKK